MYVWKEQVFMQMVVCPLCGAHKRAAPLFNATEGGFSFSLSSFIKSLVFNRLQSLLHSSHLLLYSDSFITPPSTRFSHDQRTPNNW